MERGMTLKTDKPACPSKTIQENFNSRGSKRIIRLLPLGLCFGDCRVFSLYWLSIFQQRFCIYVKVKYPKNYHILLIRFSALASPYIHLSLHKAPSKSEHLICVFFDVILSHPSFNISFLIISKSIGKSSSTPASINNKNFSFS